MTSDTVTISIQEEARLRVTSSVAMVMTLVSFSMLFATLFLGYFLHRLTSDVWPPAGLERTPSLLPTLSTLIILLSSVFLWRFEKAFCHQKRLSSIDFSAVIVTGLLFVVSQFFLWSELKSIGIYAGTTIFGSILHGFTWIHAAHIFLGFFAFGILSFKLRNTVFDVSDKLWVENVSKFWHFLSVVWLVMYFMLFIF